MTVLTKKNLKNDLRGHSTSISRKAGGEGGLLIFGWYCLVMSHFLNKSIFSTLCFIIASLALLF